ncbi:MAG: cell division protein FtsZ [Bacteroides sp.]|nr:cell division protein FtsZ [Bacteroides sp.]
MDEQDMIKVEFNIPTDQSVDTPKIIKVIGVGGGGSNAVNHMFQEGIHDVTFALCNTDLQALKQSEIPTKIQLGKEGLGAGNKPERARMAAEESIEDIKALLDDGCTKMVFITAGMGGGTGTGAAPVVAKVAKEKDILTIGIVTIPFRWEGNKKIDQALDGVEEMKKHVDALLVINNERLLEVYNNLSLDDAYAKADSTLSIAAKSIAEIITKHGKQNLDFNDVKTVLKDGGVAIMSTGYGEGDNRVSKAIKDAQYSPLLNSNDIFNSQKILFNISYSNDHQLMVNEMEEVREFLSRFSSNYELKWGIAKDDTLGEKVKITLLATGFDIQDIHVKEMDERITRRTAEEIKRIKEEEEEKDKRNQRRNKYYTNAVTTSAGRSRLKNIYTFTIEDLDNDTIIAMVENSATYNRGLSTLNAITAASQSASAPIDEETSSPTGNEETNVISFNQ